MYCITLSLVHFSPLPPCPEEVKIDLRQVHIPGLTCEVIESADDTIPSSFFQQEFPIRGTSSSYIPGYEEE